jgi:hypothetical protein
MSALEQAAGSVRRVEHDPAPLSTRHPIEFRDNLIKRKFPALG